MYGKPKREDTDFTPTPEPSAGASSCGTNIETESQMKSNWRDAETTFNDLRAPWMLPKIAVAAHDAIAPLVSAVTFDKAAPRQQTTHGSCGEVDCVASGDVVPDNYSAVEQVNTYEAMLALYSSPQKTYRF